MPDRFDSSHAERRLAAIVESSDDAIISKDLDGTITSWNGRPSACSVHGGGSDGPVDPDHHPGRTADEEDTVLARIGRGEAVDHFETVRPAKDGTLIPGFAHGVADP